MGKTHTVYSAIETLKRKGAIFNNNDKKASLDHVEYKSGKNGTLVEFIKPKSTLIPAETLCVHNVKELGNKTWGKIDFLSRHFPINGLNVYRARMRIERLDV